MTTENVREKPITKDGPSWFNRPCPTWCGNEHREDDLGDDRMHWTVWRRYIPLTVAKAVVVGDPPRPRQRVLVVYVEQHDEEHEPHVILTEQHGQQQELHLTTDDARQLAAALLHGTTIITDEENPPYDPDTNVPRSPPFLQG